MRPVGKRIVQVLDALEPGPATLAQMRGRLPDMNRKDLLIYLIRSVAAGFAERNGGVYSVVSNWREMVAMSYEDRQRMKPRKKRVNSVFQLGDAYAS